MPVTPTAASASLTSSSLNGLITAVMSFIVVVSSVGFVVAIRTLSLRPLDEYQLREWLICCTLYHYNEQYVQNVVTIGSVRPGRGLVHRFPRPVAAHDHP